MKRLICVISIFTGIGICYASESDSGAGAEILLPLNIEIIDQMSFGSMTPPGNAPGHVTIRTSAPNDLVCSVNLTCLGGGNRGHLKITGEPGRFITLPQPEPFIITDENGNTMQISEFTGAGNSNFWLGSLRINEQGFALVNFGSKLSVEPGQPAGTYSGSFLITAEYQ